MKLAIFIIVFQFRFFEIGSCWISKTSLKHMVPLPPPLKGQDYRYAPPFWALSSYSADTRHPWLAVCLSVTSLSCPGTGDEGADA